MKKTWVIILLLIVFAGLLYWIYSNRKIDPGLSKEQNNVIKDLGDGIIHLKDPHLNFERDVDFDNKEASIIENGEEIKYKIVDLLPPFNIDNEGDQEYPFILRADYYDNTKTAYVAIARKSTDKFTIVDILKIGDPDKIDDIHSQNDNEVIIEADVVMDPDKPNDKEKVMLSFTFSNDKITPGKDNIDIDNPPKPKKEEPAPEKPAVKPNTDNNGDKVVALTFDDGPGKYTPQILDILKEHGIKATFFMIGENAESHTDFVKRVHSEGHVVGNHTYDHPQMTKLSYNDQLNEIQKTNDIINNIISAKLHWFRPPYGSTNDDTMKVLSALGMEKVLWNVDTRDWSGKSSEEIYQSVMNDVKDGATVLMHDGVANSVNTAKALPDIINGLKEKGYKMVTITELRQ